MKHKASHSHGWLVGVFGLAAGIALILLGCCLFAGVLSAEAVSLPPEDLKADTDRDGFTDYEEYWAGTNPASKDSYPGKPSNPNATPEACAVLKYLALLPSRNPGKVLAGQHISATGPEYYDKFVLASKDKTGKLPAVLALQYDNMQYWRYKKGDDKFDIKNVNGLAAKWWKEGGLVEIKWSIPHPYSGLGPQTDREVPVDLKALLVSGSPGNDNLVKYLDRAALGLKELADSGVVVLWRPCSEMNGGWFWWGRKAKEDYVAFWRYMYDYFTRTKKLNNLLWVYESASTEHSKTPADLYYPGDDFVDVMGHNLYDDTWELPFDANEIFRKYPKVYAFPQAGPNKVRDGSWDNMTVIKKIKERYPRCSYFGFWDSFTSQKGVSLLAMIDNVNAEKLLNDVSVITLDDLKLQKLWK